MYAAGADACAACRQFLHARWLGAGDGLVQRDLRARELAPAGGHAAPLQNEPRHRREAQDQPVSQTSETSQQRLAVRG